MLLDISSLQDIFLTHANGLCGRFQQDRSMVLAHEACVRILNFLTVIKPCGISPCACCSLLLEN